MAISGKTTVRVGEWSFNVDVMFQIPMQKLEIVIPITSEKSFQTAEFLFAKQFPTIVIVDEKGQEFTAYDCVCICPVINIDKITILGQYKTLIKGRKIPKSGRLSFHFECLEHYFSKGWEFQNVEIPLNENEWCLVKNEETIEITSKIGVTESIESLIMPLVKVREYFEFLIDSEIYIDRVVYSDDEGVSVEILNDKLLISKNDCLFDKVSQHKPEVVAEGINQWLAHYEQYKEVFRIWRKTIYNRQVSDEDIFIWRCQSLELLCTLHTPLFDEAKYLMENHTKSFPNLYYFLKALNAKHKFIECDDGYFKEVKKVRDVYTHYNPEKHISEREWWDASHLIENALKVAIGYVVGLTIIDTGFFFLMPAGFGEDVRR